MFSWFKNPIGAQVREDGSYDPSPLTLMVGTSSKTKYKPETWKETYTGTKPILVVCTDEALMEMANQKKFNTGNHPVEMLVPMLHFQNAGFTFAFATASGKPVQLEMWTFPTKDEHVQTLYQSVQSQMQSPQKLSDITSLDGYSALFLPGGHGCMINLPFCAPLGKLLHQAHELQMPTVTLCHGPATLLSTCADGLENEAVFPFKDYQIMCFTDKTDAFTPSIGYLPGPMPWKCQERLTEKGIIVLNKTESGAVHRDRELITGDSPDAAQNLGTFAAPILVQYANEHRL